MDTTFMNSEYSKTSDPYWLLFDLSGEIKLKRSYKLVALTNLNRKI